MIIILEIHNWRVTEEFGMFHLQYMENGQGWKYVDWFVNLDSAIQALYREFTESSNGVDVDELALEELV